MSRTPGAQAAREQIGAALDAIDAAHDPLRQTPSDLAGNDFRIDVAERPETQVRTNRGLMYRFFGELADPPDGTGPITSVRDALWTRLRITPREIARRCKLAVRIYPRRSQGPDGMSRMTGLLDPEARAYLEAIIASVRPGRQQPADTTDTESITNTADAPAHDSRTPAQRCHDGLGCSRPNWLEPGYHCEVHHCLGWRNGGRTEADKLHFACGAGHAGATDGRHRTVVAASGRLAWTGGTGPPRLNHAHHPHELLYGGPGPPQLDSRQVTACARRVKCRQQADGISPVSTEKTHQPWTDHSHQ